jgi:phosphotransferase system enzyme I (PtsP)
MFPMVSSLEEFSEARDLVLRCARELETESCAGAVVPEIGIMVELPAAVELAPELASMVDFFSIGTNDLVQYLLAVDRTNEKVTYLYKPHHPAVLRAIKRVVDAAQEASIPVSVCGDMSHHREYLPFLLGIGVRALSLDPVYAPAIREAIGSLSIPHCEQAAARLLSCSRLDETEGILGFGREHNDSR